MKKLYLWTSASSARRHSKLAWHSTINSAMTRSAFCAVSPAPVVFPAPTTGVGERRGRQVDHAFPALAEWRVKNFKTTRTGIDAGGHELDGKLMPWRDIGKRVPKTNPRGRPL